MARITQKANKSPVSKWSSTSPKPKVVPTSNGKKVKAPTVQRDDRSFEQLTQEERAKLVKDLKEAEEMWAELARKLEEEEEDEPIDEETYEDLADLFSSHDNLVRRFHGTQEEEEEE